jgi:hypothetical protein
VIPPFDERGNLPPGIHRATRAELVERFGTTARRRELLAGLREALLRLAAAGCPAVWLDGSFVTSEEVPDDYDGAWEIAGVDVTRLDETFIGQHSPGKTKAKYSGTLMRVSALADPSWSEVLEFFR